MAPGHGSQSLPTLKAITYRLTTTPTEQLPLVASQISGSIWNCRDLLSASGDSVGSKNEAALLVHRFKSRIGNLLQDRTSEGRWAGIVLCKATLEAGGVEVLRKSSAWARSLIAILKKTDPASTRCLAVAALVRIFTLTWENSNLVREITTPVLPGFVNACLANVCKPRCTSREMQFVLEAFATLLPKHPTIFRAKELEIRQVAIGVVSGGTGYVAVQRNASQQHKDGALQLLALLHHCAPKQGGSTAWDGFFQAAIVAAHDTCERLFRSVTEDWTSTAGIEKGADTSILSSTEPRRDNGDRVSLPPWEGVLAGRDRLISLLGVLKSHLQSPTTATVSVRFGSLIDLLSRVLSFTVASVMDSSKANPQVSKDEREALLAVLPDIHISALLLISTLLGDFGNTSTAFIQSFTELLIEVYRAERFDENVRTAAYQCLQQTLLLCGPSMSKETVVELVPLMRGCCNDLLPTIAADTNLNGTSGEIKPASKELPLDDASKSRPRVLSHSSEIIASASSLLPALIAHLNSAYVPRKLRTQIERTAILTCNKEALLACVMNPARKDVGGTVQTSLLPLLAREFPHVPEVEALLRPRMPPVVVQGSGDDAEDADDDDDDIDEIDVTNGSTYLGLDGLDTADEDVAPSNGTAEHHSTEIEENELYNTTPPPRPASKRSAEPDPMPAAAAKRLRASPIEESASLVSQPASLPAATAMTDVPATVVADVNGGAEQTTIVCPTDALTDLAPSASRAAQSTMVDTDGDDGSDFEMPPLTMEQSDDEGDEDI